jgi:hypothetical protein
VLIGCEGEAVLRRRGCAAVIPEEFAATHPQLWETLLNEAGSRDEALQVLLVGAVVAGLEERQRPLDPAALQLLEVDEEAREDPVEVLALVLVPGDLWSALEIVDAIDSFDGGTTTGAIAERLWSDWHERRLHDLVLRLRSQLPAAQFPAASTALVTACGTFERDSLVRTRLRGELLLDALPTAADALRLAA